MLVGTCPLYTATWTSHTSPLKSAVILITISTLVNMALYFSRLASIFSFSSHCTNLLQFSIMHTWLFNMWLRSNPLHIIRLLQSFSPSCPLSVPQRNYTIKEGCFWSPCVGQWAHWLSAEDTKPEFKQAPQLDVGVQQASGLLVTFIYDDTNLLLQSRRTRKRDWAQH